MISYHCLICGKSAVYFSAGKYFCVEHPPFYSESENIIAPIENSRYTQATDLPDILRRLERVERIIAEWEADS